MQASKSCSTIFQTLLTLYRWWTLPQAEAREILKNFQRNRAHQSANRPWRDFLVCKRIIERLRRVDWTFSEIAGSESQMVKILAKHVDLDALSQGQITPLASFQRGQDHECSQQEHAGRRLPNTSTERRLFSPATEQSGAENRPSLPQPEANPEAEPNFTELQQYGWGFSPISNLFPLWEEGGDIFQLMEGDGVDLPYDQQNTCFLGDGFNLNSV